MSKQNNSLFSKSCYRLYIGNGNWINLSAKTTQDLLDIFERGEPCRYQLSPGLSIDIIPHDVDCNSKNIDLVGLMRADLVYEPHLTEHQVQQLMSHYVRNLLEERNIVDVFPPIRSTESLPAVTSISPHRHLSLVPMVFGAVRRGPKSQNTGARASQFSRNIPSSASSSSAASMANHEDHPTSSSVSSNATTHSSSSSPSSSPSNFSSSRSNKKSSVPNRNTRNRVRAQGPVRRRQRQNNHVAVPSVELTQHKMASLTTTGFPGCPQAVNIRSLPSYVHSTNNGSTGVDSYHGAQSNDHILNNHSYSVWMQPYNQMLPPPPAANEIYHTSHDLTTHANRGFDFEFNVDFEQPTIHRQSPTDILHDYDHHSVSRQNFSNSHSTGEFYELQHPNVSGKQVRQPQQHINTNSTETSAVTEATSPLESYVPTSPIPEVWIQQQQRQPWSMNFDHDNRPERNVSKKLAYENPAANNESKKKHGEVTTLPMIDRVMFHQDEPSNCDNILLSNNENTNSD